MTPINHSFSPFHPRKQILTKLNETNENFFYINKKSVEVKPSSKDKTPPYTSEIQQGEAYIDSR